MKQPNSSGLNLLASRLEQTAYQYLFQLSRNFCIFKKVISFQFSFGIRELIIGLSLFEIRPISEQLAAYYHFTKI